MATEKRLIDANEVEDLFYKQVKWGATDLMDAFDDALQDAQTVDAVEVVHGRWVNNKDDYPECDKCGYMPQYDHMIDDIWYSPYCPNCGAKMDGDGNG